jgi:hypothetical protein
MYWESAASGSSFSTNGDLFRYFWAFRQQYRTPYDWLMKNTIAFGIIWGG